VSVEYDETSERLRAVEHALAALAGSGGVPGWIQRIESEQARSAASQGKRLEDLKTSVAEKLAELIKEQRQVKRDLAQTRDKTIDTRARMYAGGAVLLALLSAAGVVVKLLT